MRSRVFSGIKHSWKKIIGFLAIFMISGSIFQGNVGGVAETYAQTSSENSVQVQTITSVGNQVNSLDTIHMIDIVLKMAYVLLWPLMVLAGWALDNTLVYGSFFHLDAPLWKFWNILKNFANFTLGFLVLFAILKSIFGNSGAGSFKDGKTPLGIIKKTLIAGVLIQASWFITAAVIDVSTVATYAVGGLPLSVMKNTDIGNQKILSVNAKLDLNKFSNITQKGTNYEVTYGAGKVNLSSCALSNNGDPSSSAKYVVGRTNSGTEIGYCVLFGNTVIPFDEIGLKEAFLDLPGNTEATYTMFVRNDGIFVLPPTLEEWNEKGYIVDITSSTFTSAKATGKSWLDSSDATTLSNVINDSKGFVGVLVTMYSSLLQFSQISDTSITSLGAVSGEVIIKACIALALIVPLIALAVVLIVRIAFLRLVIAASPLIVLKEVFFSSMKMDALNKIGFGFDLKNILAVVFAPVVTVFALSLSLIFLSTLIQSFTPSTPGTQTTSVLSPDIQQISNTTDTQKVVVMDLFGLEFQNFTRGGSLDRFSRLIVNLVAIGLLWAVLFAAIRANSLGEYVAKPIQEFGQNAMGTLPIIPYAGGEKVGIMPALGAANFGNRDSLPARRLDQRQTEQNETITKMVNKNYIAEQAPDAQQYSQIAKTLATNKTLDLSPINTQRSDDTQIQESTFLANDTYIGGVLNAIEKEPSFSLQNKTDAYTTLGTLWGNTFTQRVKDMDKDQIQAELNKNKASQAYAQTITTPITTNKGTFVVKPNTDPATKTILPYIVTV